MDCLNFIIYNKKIYDTVCHGGLANESLFAIIFKFYNKLENIINETTHLTDWSRMSSSTSPHEFIKGDSSDINFIDKSLKKNKYAIFVRKISNKFPDDILRKYIFKDSNNFTLKNVFFYFFIFIFTFNFLYFFIVIKNKWMIKLF
jgi:hypothetical protein